MLKLVIALVCVAGLASAGTYTDCKTTYDNAVKFAAGSAICDAVAAFGACVNEVISDRKSVSLKSGSFWSHRPFYTSCLSFRHRCARRLWRKFLFV